MNCSAGAKRNKKFHGSGKRPRHKISRSKNFKCW
jgi:hypothetical protein